MPTWLGSADSAMPPMPEAPRREEESTELQIRRLEQAVRALTFRNYELQQHIETLAEQLADAHEHIHQMSMTKGWRALEAARRVARPKR
jgi:hypothetical protein